MRSEATVLLLFLEVLTSVLPAFATSLAGGSALSAHNEQAEVKTRLRGQAFLETNASLNQIEEGVRTDLSFLEALPSGNSTANRQLEDQVTDLFKLSSIRSSMTKAQFDATPFGSSVKKILDLVKNTMMPKVLEAHTANQNQLINLAKEVEQCGTTKRSLVKKANVKKAAYMKFSPLHKTCRAGEAGAYQEKSTCWEEESDKMKIMKLKCQAFEMTKKHLGGQTANKQIMKKGGSESTESYVSRITATVCGNCVGKGCKLLADQSDDAKPQKCGYNPYTCGCGFKCQFDKAKDACELATMQYKKQLATCRNFDKEYRAKRKSCDSLQDQMDDSSCKRAVEMKDACESYAECHFDKKKAYDSLEDMVKQEEKDRQAEWRGLMRMQCLIKAFTSGKVSSQEVVECKNKQHSTAHLVIKYPQLPPLVKCSVPELYPSTPKYKRDNFAPLPALAKGKQDSYECTGLTEVNTEPASGSPKTCKCRRVTMNGPYSPGPVVKCVNCIDTRRSIDRNSCPDGTKLFAPRTKTDWKTFLASAAPLRAPHFIFDVTRPQNGCGGCKKKMNSANPAQSTWRTSDDAHWWLRSTKYDYPAPNYHANCYMNLYMVPKSADEIVYKSSQCDMHAKSYYCQAKQVSMEPKRGSPKGCVCKPVALNGKYSAGALIKCVGCLRVSRSMQKNSCPIGTKIFSPATRQDWKTFLASATPLRSPNWIIDVTQPQNGCGGCTRNAMNSRNPAQATWRTTDSTAWFLRSTKFSEPNGDYHANCYLNLNIPANENSVTFNDHKCNYNSNAYYCQPAKVKKKPAPAPSPPPPSGPPDPEAGGKYVNYKCVKGSEYTGVKSCGHFTGLSEKQCHQKCDKSASAQDKKSCDKITGIPNCVGYVWLKKTKTCILERSCKKLVKAFGARTVLKKTYNPDKAVFKKLANTRCNSSPYTQPGGDRLGLKGVTEAQCWKACFGNRWSSHKKVPVKQCVAMAFYKSGGYCDLYDKCDKTTGSIRGVVTYKKLEKFEKIAAAKKAEKPKKE